MRYLLAAPALFFASVPAVAADWRPLAPKPGISIVLVDVASRKDELRDRVQVRTLTVFAANLEMGFDAIESTPTIDCAANTVHLGAAIVYSVKLGEIGREQNPSEWSPIDPKSGWMSVAEVLCDKRKISDQTLGDDLPIEAARSLIGVWSAG